MGTLLLGTVLSLVVLGRAHVFRDFPENEYVYSARRDWLVAAERELQEERPTLNSDETVVDNYLNYLKWEEYIKTHNETVDNFPPARPVEEVQESIRASEVYRVLEKLPKGGNMHSHEYHQLSKRTLYEIVWNSDDFEHLYILPENHPTDPWKLDFFINPPETTPPWINVKENQDRYSLEQVLPNQILFGFMSDYAKSRPTDSAQRWRELDTLWLRGSFQVAGNLPIKKRYLEEMYRQGLQEGIQYIETRRSFSDFERLYVLDADPQYAGTNGKHYFPQDTEIEVTLEVVANITKDHPEFIGHRRIGFVQRQMEKSVVRTELNRIVDLNLKYPDHVIGADLVGQEDAGNSHLFYIDALLELLDPATGESKIPLFLHSSETNWLEDIRSSVSDSDLVGTLQNAYETLLLKSRRIGHGFGFSKHPGLMEVLRGRGIAIELCPVSNQVLGYSPDLRNHPGTHFLRSGVPVVLGSDDPGTFGIDGFTIDWYEVFMAWGLGLPDLKQLAFQSLKYSGMSPEQSDIAINEKWMPKWNEYITDMKSEACSRDFTSGSDPNVVRILPRSGAVTGTTKVHIFGRNFQRGICKNIKCKFGELESSRAVYISHEHLLCETPDRGAGAGQEEVSVSLSLDNGATYISTGERFNYKFPLYVISPDPSSNGVRLIHNNIISIPLVFVVLLYFFMHV